MQRHHISGKRLAESLVHASFGPCFIQLDSDSSRVAEKCSSESHTILFITVFIAFLAEILAVI